MYKYGLLFVTLFFSFRNITQTVLTRKSPFEIVQDMADKTIVFITGGKEHIANTTLRLITNAILL